MLLNFQKTLLLLALLGIGLALVGIMLLPSIAHADRADNWLASTVDTYQVTAHELPDGGCSVDACASYRKLDGGAASECSGPIDLTAGSTGQTRCLNLLNSADTVFKTAKAL